MKAEKLIRRISQLGISVEQGDCLEELGKFIDTLRAERDAAVNSLRTHFGNCQYCKHYDFLTHRCKSTPNSDKCWEWKGIQNDK